MNSVDSNTDVYSFVVKDIQGNECALSRYRGSVLLVVNVASYCVFTGQYRMLQQLQDRYQAQGFNVLGFPCNQFANQEPKSEEQIQEFCSLKYEVQFPLFSKVMVNGPQTHPLYAFLKRQAPGMWGTQAIKWNFTKFLIGRNGQVIARFSPASSPRALTRAIESALGNAS